MSKPQTKILYVTEGNPVALLHTNTAGRRNIGHMKIASPEAGLVWCRKNGCVMIYTPAIKFRNN
jgi:hypothetical protein